MITAYLISPTRSSAAPAPLDKADQRALSRLIAAAVINQGFCRLLLLDPAKAIGQGFNGENFGLSKQAENLVLSIRASTLPEFALALDRVSFPNPISSSPMSYGQFPEMSLSPIERLIHPQ